MLMQDCLSSLSKSKCLDHNATDKTVLKSLMLEGDKKNPGSQVVVVVRSSTCPSSLLSKVIRKCKFLSSHLPLAGGRGFDKLITTAFRENSKILKRRW